MPVLVNASVNNMVHNVIRTKSFRTASLLNMILEFLFFSQFSSVHVSATFSNHICCA